LKIAMRQELDHQTGFTGGVVGDKIAKSKHPLQFGDECQVCGHPETDGGGRLAESGPLAGGFLRQGRR
jgi:hypothetical protein